MNDEWARGEDGMNAGASRWAADAEGEAGKSRLTLEFFDSIFWGFFFNLGGGNRRRPRRLHLPAVFTSPSAGISRSAGNIYCSEHLTETLCVKRQDPVGQKESRAGARLKIPDARRSTCRIAGLE